MFICFGTIYSKLANIGNVKYNEDTDSISVLYNGEWIDVLSAKIQWSGDIYTAGVFDTKSGITGAYTKLQIASGSVTFEQSRIKLYSKGNESSSGIAKIKFDDDIDFTNIKSLNVTVSHSYVQYMNQAIPGLYIMILDSSNNILKQLLIAENCSNKVFSLNTEDLIGRYYIGLQAASRSWSTDSYGTSYITKMNATLK